MGNGWHDMYPQVRGVGLCRVQMSGWLHDAQPEARYGRASDMKHVFRAGTRLISSALAGITGAISYIHMRELAATHG